MDGLYGLLHESSLKYQDRIFIRRGNNVWTYCQAEFMARRISGYLLRNGIQKGDRVVVFCDNSIQYIAAFFGIMKIRAVAVPVNPAKMADSFLYILEKSNPGMILACDATMDKLNRMNCEPDANNLYEVNNKFVTKIINLDRSVLGDKAEHVTDPDAEPDFCASGSGNGHIRLDADTNADSNVDFSADTNNDVDADSSDDAVILFTSGTTAYPKGVTLTHGNLMANTEAIIEYLHLTREDSILMTLPFTYSYGNSVLLTHTCVGASIVIDNNSAYPYKILESIKEYQVSGFSTVGSYINLMLKCVKNCGRTVNFFEALRYITFAGESTNNEDVLFIIRNFPHTKVYVMYGQTEAAARLSYLSPELLPGKIGSIGRGLCNVRLEVVNESGNIISPGEIGEIIAQGPNVMKGYWNDPRSTEEVLSNGWLHTGDNATIDDDGYIYIKGRKTDIIKYMGHRISPVEIENVINTCELVKESAVVESILDTAVVIKAFIVPEKNCTLEEVKKYISPRLPVYMRPQVLEVIGRLPRTDSGKIKRSVLRSNLCAE
jgi:long-chain acyl-CoA synthetase